MSAGRSINSQSKEWGTPQKYVDAVTKFFGEIDLDPCSNLNSIVPATTRFILPLYDGLKESWASNKRVYVNPPYGIDKERKTSIKDWLAKCVESNKKHGCEVLALIPVATNTGHWKNSVFGKASAICFLADTRLKFLVNGKDGGKGAPMACCIVYWGAHLQWFKFVFKDYGSCVDIRNLKG